MHEPNLQNVPRTFSIPCEFLTMNKGKGDEGVIEFNCRNIFKAAPGYVMVSADYCQLEMRILTHFSADSVLSSIMSSDLDVFKSIAASWANISDEEVGLEYYGCYTKQRAHILVHKRIIGNKKLIKWKTLVRYYVL